MWAADCHATFFLAIQKCIDIMFVMSMQALYNIDSYFPGLLQFQFITVKIL